MIKAIFFDIDGTLVTNRSTALTSTREAIKAAQAKGILCGVATGRGPVNIEELVDHLELDMYVTYNGQLVYTKEETIFAEPFSETDLKEIVTFADTRHRQIIFGSRYRLDGSTTMMLGNSKFAKRLSTYIPKWFPVRGMKRVLQSYSPNKRKQRYANLSILTEPIYQCIMLSPESELDKLAQDLPQCSLQRSNPYSVDLIPKGGSKIRGIEAFLSAMNIDVSEAMAFGDNYNDHEMLQGVGIGVAMGNGRSATKAIADYVTDTNERDGIAKALRHFQVIE